MVLLISHLNLPPQSANIYHNPSLEGLEGGEEEGGRKGGRGVGVGKKERGGKEEKMRWGEGGVERRGVGGERAVWLVQRYLASKPLFPRFSFFLL